MKPKCTGLCSRLAMLQKVRQTEHPFYLYENWCPKCEIAYLSKTLQTCECCKGPLRDKSKNYSPIKERLQAQERRH